MTSALDIHPEDLIDKLVDSGLTDLEQDRLRAHLTQCASCRFEIAARGDLAAETTTSARPQLSFVASPAAHSGQALAARPVEQAEPRAAVTLRPRARRHWTLVAVAAAFVLFAGVATAAVVSGTITVRLPWAAQLKSAAPLSLTDALGTKRFAAKSAAVKLSPPAAGALPVVTQDAAASAVPQSPAASPASAPLRRSVSVKASAMRSTRTPVAPGEAARASAVGEAPSKPSLDVPATIHVAPEASAPTDVPQRTDAAALFAEANRARRDGNGEHAAQLYRSLQARYPNAAESELSRAVLAQMLLERGNAEGALAGFNRYLAEDSPVLSAEALVGRARALEQLGKREQAVAAWKQVQSRFPGSVHARLAALRLTALDMR